MKLHRIVLTATLILAGAPVSAGGALAVTNDLTSLGPLGGSSPSIVRIGGISGLSSRSSQRLRPLPTSPAL